MDTVKKIGLGVGIGLALAAYLSNEAVATWRTSRVEYDGRKCDSMELTCANIKEKLRQRLAAHEDHKAIREIAGNEDYTNASEDPVTVTGIPPVVAQLEHETRHEQQPQSHLKTKETVVIEPRRKRKANGFRIAQLVSRAEQCFPNAIATISASGQQRTYAQFGKRVRSAATGFIAELGVNPGDRVAILSLNSELFLESFFSISFAGALPVPLNIRLSIAELAESLNDCSCKVLLVDESFFAIVSAIKDRVKSIEKVVTLGSDQILADAMPLETLIDQHSPLKESIDFEGCEGISSNVYGIFYTGGTTGRSKGVMLSHEGLIFNAYTIANMVRYTEGIKYLHATPMFHLVSGTATFGVTMSGGTHCFVPKFSPDAVLRSIQQNKITHALFVPSYFNLVLSEPTLKEYDLRSVRYFLYGGSIMPEKVLIGAMKAFPGSKFVQGYGMTEASVRDYITCSITRINTNQMNTCRKQPLMTYLGAEHHDIGSALLGSVGQCVPHGEIRILDQDGEEVPRGVTGEICYRGPNVMVGYYNMPETTEVSLRGGWLHTGDGGRMNEQGFVYISDRLKDIINSGGESVYSQEVEHCIAKLSGVQACAVIGIPDPILVEKVAAIIVVKKDSGLTKEQVVEHCRARIARYKCPREVIFRTEPLPMSGAGKVLKTVLREPFWKDSEQANIYASSDAAESLYDSAEGK